MTILMWEIDLFSSGKLALLSFIHSFNKLSTHHVPGAILVWGIQQ